MADYRLEELIKTFKENWKISDAEEAERRKTWRENFPDAPEPEHFKKDFNINRALLTMCEEIKKLKERE